MNVNKPPVTRLANGRAPVIQQQEAKQLAKLILASPEYRQSLLERASNGTLPPAVEVTLWHYAYGKPKETVEIQQSQDFSQLSSEELLQRTEELKQTLSLVHQHEQTIDVSGTVM